MSTAAGGGSDDKKWKGKQHDDSPPSTNEDDDEIKLKSNKRKEPEKKDELQPPNKMRGGRQNVPQSPPCRFIYPNRRSTIPKSNDDDADKVEMGSD